MPILYEKEDKVVTITISRPEALNALNPELCQEFSDVLIKFRDDNDAWVAIITGAGRRAFCVGADIRTLLPVLVDGSFKTPPLIVRGLDIWKPIIAAINGLCLGGGLETALACDIRIAAENATMGVPEVRWGVHPGWGGTQRLPRAITRAKASEMLFMGTTIDANEAYRIGLVNKVVPLDELMSTAKEWAAKICENGPIAVRLAKRAMLLGIDMTLEEGLKLELDNYPLFLDTEDLKEGLSAFAEKRKPVYKAR